MKVKDLVSEWLTQTAQEHTHASYQVRLSVYDAAKIAALRDLFPGLEEERILTDLVSAALGELTNSFSYEPGDEIAGYDEHGDPMYSDAGLAPRFQNLAKRYAKAFEQEQNA